MRRPDHLTCLLRNPYASQEATVRALCGTMDWFRTEKGVAKAVSCHPAEHVQSTSREMLHGWSASWNQDCREKYQQPQICRRYHSNGRKQELKNLLKEESEKASLKLNIKKNVIMASGPSTSWQIEGEEGKQWQTLSPWALRPLQP